MTNFLKIVLIHCLVMISYLAQSQDQSLELKYLGCAGWEIKDGKTTILIDPYLSRLKLGKGASISKEDDRKSYTKADYFESDTALIDSLITIKRKS